LVCTIGEGGGLLGMARYELADQFGSFLDLGLSDASGPLFASVNGRPVDLLRSATGRWLIPLGDEGAAQVVFVWRTDPPVLGTTGPRTVFLPDVGRVPVSTMVTLYAPERVEVKSRAPRLQPLTLDRAFLDEAGWIRDEVARSFDGFDRSSRRDGEDL